MRNTFIASAVSLILLAACGGGSKEAATPKTADASGSANTPAKASESTAPKVALEATKELKIYNWSDYVDPQTVKDFEAANQIKVTYDVYDSNESLEAKVLTGKSGYDLVVPSNSHVGRQIKAGAYQEIDKSLIPNYANIEPTLLKMLEGVDPGNKYAVPYFWGINTMAINKDKVEKALGGQLPDNKWDLLFNPQYTNKLKSCGISILDSATEVFPMVLNYIGKNPNSSEPEDMKAAKDVIMKVRPDIRRFSSSGYIDDLARGDVCVVLGYGGDLNIASRRAKEAGTKVNIEILVPKEGFGVWVDSFMIPKDAGNLANAYKYINDTLDAKVAAKNGNFVTYAPASKGAKELMEKDYADNASIFPSAEQLKNGFMMNEIKPDAMKLSTRLWQDIKKGS
ncbi:polyamine ABC transporter substrate-binding protein [Vitreoscilla massiliensis]|uniref:Putrescine-binding periplasmic protein n=1 Tax=Vitreoscilla massiliensis TaxID=1689272 RepID=A0ABY4E8N6_9NEIS|nr:polyamine ABC transporter substrate-binding protein [Vitreoscilla massiliensis]UOO91275.1 polyamine ABC transporter substrate-binding protein [Vitreoscilla massiliensis]